LALELGSRDDLVGSGWRDGHHIFGKSAHEPPTQRVVDLVLRDDAFPWRRYSHRSYVHSASPGAVLDLSLALVGIGIRRQGNWLWSDGIYMPPA
jgi:hypothetical protein